MAYNILATCDVGPIISHRVQPGRAVKQARDYRKRGYTEIRIVELDTGHVFDADGLAKKLEADRLQAEQLKAEQEGSAGSALPAYTA
jgi:hypothetical protein